MSIQVDLSSLNHHTDTAHATTKVNSESELEDIRTRDTKVIVEGDIFTYRGVSFKPMSQDELLAEKIDIKSLHLTQVTSSNKPKDDRVIVAFRDPSDPENIIAYKLDKEIVAELKNSFANSDFFQREDGILRLNAKAEAYIAGWLLDIKENRGYEKADINADGIVDQHESNNLNVGFDHSTDYEYLASKIVTAHSFVGNRTYQKFSDTSDRFSLTGVLSNQALNFKNTIEKELSYTIKLDKDKNGTITLKEGMVDFTPKDKSVENHLVDKIQRAHDTWVRHFDIVLDTKNIMARDISVREITTDKERKEVIQAMKESSKKVTKWFKEHPEMPEDMGKTLSAEKMLKDNDENTKESVRQIKGKLSVEMELAESKMYGKRNL